MDSRLRGSDGFRTFYEFIVFFHAKENEQRSKKSMLFFAADGNAFPIGHSSSVVLRRIIPC
jgi:hypothetical protein